MAKAKDTAFFCKECGYESAKWFGQCPACRAWNTAVEQPVAKAKAVKGVSGLVTARTTGTAAKATKLSEISMEDKDRTATGIQELDRVLGGGIVDGSLVL
ncbi:MAG: DNA repair protein RadA, partial [Lachnospira sp.]|nr:DNA repair protein RadA [Lachnospira sp.]